MNRFLRFRCKRPSLQDAENSLKGGIGGGMRAEDYVSVADRKERLASLADDIEDKLKTHLPRTRNLELMVIKCHLMLEFMLNQFIELMAPTECDVHSVRFQFPEKVFLVHMLGFPSGPTI